MDREERDRSYELLKSQPEIKEYIFATPAMYRQFFVLGKDLKDAEQNFMRIDDIKRNGFTLEDLPIRLEFVEEECKNWKIEDFWANNENIPYKQKGPYKDIVGCRKMQGLEERGLLE